MLECLPVREDELESLRIKRSDHFLHSVVPGIIFNHLASGTTEGNDGSFDRQPLVQDCWSADGKTQKKFQSKHSAVSLFLLFSVDG